MAITGAHVLVSGASGAGKTHLAERQLRSGGQGRPRPFQSSWSPEEIKREGGPPTARRSGSSALYSFDDFAGRQHDCCRADAPPHPGRDADDHADGNDRDEPDEL